MIFSLSLNSNVLFLPLMYVGQLSPPCWAATSMTGGPELTVPQCSTVMGLWESVSHVNSTLAHSPHSAPVETIAEYSEGTVGECQPYLQYLSP